MGHDCHAVRDWSMTESLYVAIVHGACFTIAVAIFGC